MFVEFEIGTRIANQSACPGNFDVHVERKIGISRLFSCLGACSRTGVDLRPGTYRLLLKLQFLQYQHVENSSKSCECGSQNSNFAGI